ncbi:MAG: tRNA (adenosine(37)-N6)-threonylcarbamoyltransferase complex ATPase subunit type 1 TsaE [Deltaproteobacteria bacterium]|nr:tRNA (adenosine(37)-N6)-threonylcarbamoyltransferase complex ATPase subunit type 1 TsaE [Deltaproteobacteria bacterium]
MQALREQEQEQNGPVEEVTLRLESLAETRALGLRLGPALPENAIVLLEGEMGSGKTTLIKAICEALGVNPAVVISPTYTLVNVYPGIRSVFHVDLFRLEDPESLLELDRDDWINPRGISLVEWPREARRLLAGEDWLEIRLDPVPDNSQGRFIKAAGCRRTYAKALEAIRDRTPEHHGGAKA